VDSDPGPQFRSPMYCLDHTITPEEVIATELGDNPPQEVLERHKSGVCVQCGGEPAIDGLYGARCMEDTATEHRRARYAKAAISSRSERFKQCSMARPGDTAPAITLLGMRRPNRLGPKRLNCQACATLGPPLCKGLRQPTGVCPRDRR